VGVLAGEDANAWADVATFVVGDVLLVAPVIDEGATTRTLFVPEGEWIPFDDAGEFPTLGGPALATVNAPLTGGVPLWVRAGTTLTLADPQLMSLLDTALAEDGGFNHFAQTQTRTFE
jgi:alpha-glucosidase